MFDLLRSTSVWNLKNIFQLSGMAFIDLVVKYGWDSVTIMYENNESMMRLKEIFTRTTEVRTQYLHRLDSKPLVWFFSFWVLLFWLQPIMVQKFLPIKPWNLYPLWFFIMILTYKLRQPIGPETAVWKT